MQGILFLCSAPADPVCPLQQLHRVINVELKTHRSLPTTIPRTRPIRSWQRFGYNATHTDAYSCACLAYRYLTAVDIEGFSSLHALDQLQMLDDLSQILDIAATRVGLDRALWQVQERGDGELAVLPPDTDGPRLIADYPRELADALSEVNSERRSRLRIRMAMHHGTLVQGRFGPVGQGPIVVSRLLDSDELRKYLAQRVELDVVLIVSASLHSDVIETRLHHLDPAQFTRADVLVKGRPYPAYIHTANRRRSTARELSEDNRTWRPGLVSVPVSFAKVRARPPSTGPGRRRCWSRMNRHLQTWKACCRQRLASSNLASSASR